ncbi:MAG TPA: ATP-binding protein [Terracidiphilus sp.]|jgi:signal transduction histidine kinase/DNA-binding NarL/FixJ family response regulator
MQHEFDPGDPVNATGVEPANPQEMPGLVERFDWSKTPLGPDSTWPDSLKAVVRILLTSRFPMWMAWGSDLTVLYNDAYRRTTLGKKHPWALGKPASQVWHEIWKDIGPRIQQVMETGEASWDEMLMLILERSGYPEETYHTFSYSPLSDSDGRIVGMLCVVMEDTERVIGERQLTALGTLAEALSGATSRQEVFAAIERGLANQKDMPCTLTYMFDEDGVRLNLVARTGMDHNHPAASLVIDPDESPAAWPISQILSTNRGFTVENLAELFPDLPPGCWDKPPTRARLVPIARQGQDKPIGIFITAINPYRQFDGFYEGFLDLITGQIAASINNASAYEQERKRAEELSELDRAKTTFFSNVSHELRTPLTLILGPIEDALTSQAPPSPQNLEMLHRNALRLLKLVNGLLDFVRIEVGKLRATFEPTDLCRFTAQLASVFRSAVERAGLKLVVDCPPLPEPVYLDREMWEKIILNLISNALKSTFEGEIRVTVRAAEHDVLVSVSDTGTGISESDLPNLFQRFSRIDGARRRSHEGSGIGLALVQELVEMHGGSIEVKSAVDIGTEFTITLHFGQEHLTRGRVAGSREARSSLQGSGVAYVQEAMGWLSDGDSLKDEIAPAVAGDEPPEPAASSSGRKPVVLLADDNADMREYVSGLLRGRFQLVEAATGKTALAQAKQVLPDLVLTDIMMPEMDGFELLAALRENPATRSVPVIMLSARAGEEARVDGVDAGADDYLTKPFSARELVARVEAQLKLARLRKEAMEQQAALNLEISRTRRFAWEVLEHIPDIFYTFDREFRFSYMNAAGSMFAERMGKNLLGQRVWDVLPELRGTLVESNFWRVMEERQALEFEYYYEPFEGWFRLHVYPLPDDGIILYAREITEARKTEEALRKSEQLAVAGRLAASIAHEINNPLEAVTNLLYLARMDSSEAGNSRALLEEADKELRRLSHIAARSLKFYRQHTAPTWCSLEEQLESVLFFYETEIKMRNIVLERRHRPAPLVLYHAGEFRQVITNLIGNALDALPRFGHLVVSVRPAEAAAGRPGVAVTVADNGSGMDRQILDRLFHPFATTKGEAGTGLGLWVSKGILDKHSSTIAVRSKRNCGTVFRLFVPLEEAASEGQVPELARG